jgi:multiple sugar transport system substrate-binding protein
MSKISYTRRQVCQLGLTGLASLAALDLAGCGSSGSTTSSETMQLSFWGDVSRNKLTRKAITGYQKAHSNVTINSWFADFNSYFNKLNTQIAGGGAPDLIQMDMSYLAEYVKEHTLLDLGPMIGNKSIDLSDFDQDLLANSKANNAVYGIPMGGNYECMIYDTQIVQDAGVGAPPATWTWDEYAAYSSKVSQALASKKIYGSPDTSGAFDVFEIWVRQRGNNLYTQDGKIGFTADDTASWFDYWDKLRKAGACAPAEIQAAVTNSGPAATLLVQGKVAFAIAHSNQFHGFQVLSKHKYALQQVPTGDKPGNFLKPSMLISIAAKSKYANDAASFINYVTTNPEGVQALSLDRGIPGSVRARQALQTSISDENKAVLAFAEQVANSGQSRPKTILDPPGAGKLTTILLKVSQSVSFGKQSSKDGATTLMQQLQAALG